MGFDQNNVKLIILNSQHIVVYYVIFADFLLMSLFLTMPIFQKCTNIGAVFLPTVYSTGLLHVQYVLWLNYCGYTCISSSRSGTSTCNDYCTVIQKDYLCYEEALHSKSETSLDLWTYVLFNSESYQFYCKNSICEESFFHLFCILY